MTRGSSPTPSNATRARDEIELRRNRAEMLVRDRLAATADAYVQRSSWRTGAAGPEPFVAVIARNESGRDAVRRALTDVVGMTDEQWRSSWIGLNLGDFMIRVSPTEA